MEIAVEATISAQGLTYSFYFVCCLRFEYLSHQ